jgi:hypothetical protein
MLRLSDLAALALLLLVQWRVTVILLRFARRRFQLARFFTPYVHGLYRLGRAAAYVTRGIGTIGFPARLGALPEITVVRLRKA